MSESRKYDPLRDTAKRVDAERQFKEAGNDLAARRTGDQPEQTQEAPFLTELEKYEAARDAKTQELDAKVQAGQIDRHEMKYQLSRFENEVSPVKGDAAPAQSVGQQQERKLVFSEDRERAATGERSNSQANREKARGQSKVDGRAPSFFEDRNSGQEKDRGR